MSEKKEKPCTQPPQASYVCNMQLNVDPSEQPRIRSICLPEVHHRSTDSEDQKDECLVDMENVTVKFHISETDTVAQVYPNTITMAEVKQDISRKFEVDPHLLILKQNNRVLCNNVPIYWTASDEFGIHEFELLLNLPEGNKTRLSMNVYYELVQLQSR